MNPGCLVMSVFLYPISRVRTSAFAIESNQHQADNAMTTRNIFIYDIRVSMNPRSVIPHSEPINEGLTVRRRIVLATGFSSQAVQKYTIMRDYFTCDGSGR